MKIPNLPPDLTKITATQYRAAVCHLARQPLAELRKHQMAIHRQEKRARRHRNRAMLDRLYTLERIAADAIFEHEFGPAICRWPRKRR